MIDWLTLVLPFHHLPANAVEIIESRLLSKCVVAGKGNGALSIGPHIPLPLSNGDSRVSVSTYNKNKDSLCLMGSPARIGQSNNVFGSDDIRACASSMIQFAGDMLGITLPTDLKLWGLKRLDVTENYFMTSPEDVRSCLHRFFNMTDTSKSRWECGTLYWNWRAPSANNGSKYCTLKGYTKGQHLRHQLHRGEARATPEQLAAADHLMRLEVTFGPKFLDRLPVNWYTLTPGNLWTMYREPCAKFVPGKLFVENNSIQQVPLRLDDASKKTSAFVDDLQRYGVEAIRARTKKTTWSRRKNELAALRLTVCDVVAARNCGTSVCFDLDKPVRSWDECRALMGLPVEQADDQATNAVGDGNKPLLARVIGSLPLAFRGARPWHPFDDFQFSAMPMRPIARAVGLASTGP